MQLGTLGSVAHHHAFAYGMLGLTRMQLARVLEHVRISCTCVCVCV